MKTGKTVHVSELHEKLKCTPRNVWDEPVTSAVLMNLDNVGMILAVYITCAVLTVYSFRSDDFGEE